VSSSPRTRWGTMPSAELNCRRKWPTRRRGARKPRPGVADRFRSASSASPPPRGFRDVWYGFYSNGREVLLGIETVHGNDLTAVYAVGPSIDDKYPSAGPAAKATSSDDAFVFESPGNRRCAFARGPIGVSVRHGSRPTQNVDAAHMKPIDPHSLAAHDGGKGSPSSGRCYPRRR